MIYLIEEVPNGFKCLPEDSIIALTPIAIYDLDVLGLPYKIPEDFFDFQEINLKKEKYFFDQLNHFKILDEIVDEIITFKEKTGIGPVWLYYYFLKIIVDEPLIYLEKIIHILNNTNDKEIIYISREFSKLKNKNEISHLLNKGNILYKCILPIYCKKNSIKYSEFNIKDKYIQPSIPKRISSIKKTLVLLKKQQGFIDFIRKIKIFFSLINLFTYVKNKTINKTTKYSKQKTILFLNTNWGLQSQALKALRKGHRVIIKIGQRFYEHTGGTLNYIDKLPEFTPSEPHTNWQKLKNDKRFIQNFRSWYTKKAGCYLSEIVEKKLHFFLDYICPGVIHFHLFYYNLIEQEEIDFIIMPHLWHLESFAAMAAAKKSASAKGVLVQHGQTVFKNFFSIMVRLGVSDIFVTLTQELKDHYEKTREILPINTAKPLLAVYYFDELEKIKAKRLHKTKRKKIETIVYVPTFFQHHTRRFNSVEYSPTWYYKHQLRMLNLFAQHNSFHFVWKGLTKVEHSLNPIPFYISDKRYKNISISEKPFTYHLANADRVITDWGSTAFFESMTTGIPTICVAHKSLKVRDNIISQLGLSYQKFDSFSEIQEHINSFLYGDSQDYTQEIAWGKDSLITALENLDLKSERQPLNI